MDYDKLHWEPEVLANEYELINQILTEIEHMFLDNPAKWGIIGIAATDEPHDTKSANDWVLGLASDLRLPVAQRIIREIRVCFPLFQQQDLIEKNHAGVVQVYIKLPHEIVR